MLAQTAKLLANAKQLVRKNCLLFEKSGNFLHRANLQDERTFWMPTVTARE